MLACHFQIVMLSDLATFSKPANFAFSKLELVSESLAPWNVRYKWTFTGSFNMELKK